MDESGIRKNDGWIACLTIRFFLSLTLSELIDAIHQQ
jgi:hypothetical protein